MDDPIHILMVEDMVVDANLAEREIRKVIRSCSFQRVDTREDFVRAMSIFKPDLVITDYTMPRFDGMTALKLSIEIASHIPVIVLTGAINEDTAVECMKAGATDYVIKEHVKRLGQAVVHALEESQIREQRRKAEETLRERDALYRTLVETLPDPMIVTNTVGNVTYLSPMALHFFGYDSESDVLGMNFMNWLHPDSFGVAIDSFQQVISGSNLRNVELLICKKDRSVFYGEVTGSCLRDGYSNIIGAIINVRDISERKRADLALRESEALYRTRNAELETLFTLSTLLRQAQNADDMLHVVLSEVKELMVVDSVAIILLDKEKEQFTITHATGSLIPDIGKSFSVHEDSISKQVLVTEKPYSTADYMVDPHRLKEKANFAIEDIQSAVYVPVQSENEILGILMMSKPKGNSPPLFGSEDVRLLSTIGDMTGNYLRKAWLVDDLNHLNQQITNAYEDTIDALSRALDLRDKDTEGHTSRVIELTLALARKVGMDDSQLVHVRRGAYLHDMGKIGIPDAILLKPGVLTDEEWEIMRRHPQYTFDMLSHIDYLVPALDIPYCHHEKWDGTGYPRGLKGDEIPLAARLFAIVDVWDALTSDRPYRQAWPDDVAINYIREQSGKFFDPRIVDVFLRIVQTEHAVC